MENKYFLNDGTILSNIDDLENHLVSLGFSDLECLYEDILVLLGIDDRNKNLSDELFVQELAIDHMKACADELCDQVEAIAEKLLCGKSGKGYTKTDLGYALKNAAELYLENV